MNTNEENGMSTEIYMYEKTGKDPEDKSIEFNAKYGTEEKCRGHLHSVRWVNGFVCPKCKHDEYFDIKSRNLYQCKKCNHQASVTAGRIMEKTRTPLVKWYFAMYYMSEDKRGISALALMGKIGVSYQHGQYVIKYVKQ